MAIFFFVSLRPSRGVADANGLPQLLHQPMDLPRVLQLQVSPRSADETGFPLLGNLHPRDLSSRQP